jgi:type IV pilus assembly protein PilE
MGFDKLSPNGVASPNHANNRGALGAPKQQKETKMKRSMQSAKGFTLIELLIVVVIVGLLAKVAFPSYQDSVRKSRRADAQSGLLQLAQFMERTNTLSNTYTPGGANPTLPTSVTSSYYTFSITAATASSFTLSAVFIAGTSQANDMPGGIDCTTLTITNTGVKSPAGCW